LPGFFIHLSRKTGKYSVNIFKEAVLIVIVILVSVKICMPSSESRT